MKTLLRAAALFTVTLIVAARLLIELKEFLQKVRELWELIKEFGFVSALQRWETWSADDWVYNGILFAVCFVAVSVATWYLHMKSLRRDAEEFLEELEERRPGLLARLQGRRRTLRELFRRRK
jgi:hypothetical protein